MGLDLQCSSMHVWIESSWLLLLPLAGEASCVGPPFLRRWHDFLATLQKNIKSTEIEDQNVKVRSATGGDGWWCAAACSCLLRRCTACCTRAPPCQMCCLQMLSTVYDVEYKNVVDGLNPMLV